MGMTIIEKIMARASGAKKVSPGDLVVVDVDTAVFIDNAFFPAAWREVLHVADPDRIVVIFDHRAPASDRTAAAAHVVGRAFVKRFGIERFHDVGRDVGIAHVVVSDRAYALPGTVLVCADSHTCSGGAFNCAARGVGAPDMIYAATTGKSWFRIGETIRYDLEGRLGAGVTTKDVFLHLAGTFGEHANQNVEFGGSGLKHLSLNARRTISTMGAELSAEFATFEADDLLLDYVKKRNQAPFEAQYPDQDAVYKARRTIKLGEMEPLVALPDSVVNNSVRVSEVAGTKIDQAFIGSCANGTLDDFAIAAKVLEGKRVADGVRLIMTPGSQEIYRDAIKAGYVEIVMEAGALVTNATCGACGGGHLGVLGPNEVCITASTRNFKGRMGDPSARIYMGSPATVAASAIAGAITHPGEFTKEALS
ncbi:MAG: 3-isopropylmalate dehydratase large subunit [Alphaproteobacteria bacterium]|nr:3-isopropylmalate dehydratase large subunit [Alphaproteobacteria bacterium]